MEKCNCSKESEISELQIKLKSFEKVLFGNGKPGVYENTIRLQETVESLIETTSRVTTGMSGFNKFQIETEATIRENEKHAVNKKWYITTIIAFGAVAVAFVGIFIFN